MSIIGVALSRNAQDSQRVVIPFECASSAAVGDLVYHSSVDEKFVISATDNLEFNKIIGIIYQKPSATLANVLIIGIYSGFTGLTIGGHCFLSTSGGITQTRPTTGFLHSLGVAVSDTEVLFIPNNIRVKLI